MKLEGKVSQRFGQLLMNALNEYLVSQGRFVNDDELAKCLFYLSDEDLNQIVDKYIVLCEARGEK